MQEKIADIEIRKKGFKSKHSIEKIATPNSNENK
jgi:hypothetical protein